MKHSKPIPAITCGTHGKQPQTFVCVHIIESLKADEPAGFWWGRGEDGAYDAVCTACNDLSQKDFEALGADNIKLLCFGCFQDAAALNEVELE